MYKRQVWGMCGPLRDDGVSYGDYLEQLTYLIFLKMSDEYSKPPYKRETGIPAGCGWSDMNTLKGAELESKYKSILETLGEQGGTLGKIFQAVSYTHLSMLSRFICPYFKLRQWMVICPTVLVCPLAVL